MSESYRPEVGRWWKFDRYVIEKGAIQPAEGANLSAYDPWSDYEASRARGGGQEPPYQSLLTLLQQVRFDANNSLTPESALLVCDWCSSHGLLGILTQEFDGLPSRFLWDHETIPDSEEFEAAGPDGLRMDTKALGTWVWSPPASWTELPFFNVTTWNYREGPQLALPSQLIRFFFADVWEWVNFGRGRQPILAPPFSEEFWRRYREPVNDFLERAKGLTSALKYFSSPIPEDIWSDGWVHDDNGLPSMRYIDFWADVTYLNELTSNASIGLGLDATGCPREVIGFRSLLASFALMILHDVTGGRKVNVCANCGTPFTSTSPKAGYCSLRCRNTAQKRRQREREKKARQKAGDQ